MSRLVDFVNEYKGSRRKGIINFIKSIFAKFKNAISGIGKLENKFLSLVNEKVNTTSEQNKTAERKFSVAGENAESAEKLKLSTAKQMEKDGADSETIRKETGWYKGGDGVWRFRIADNEMRFYHNKLGKEPITLGECVKHDKLFKAYPQLKDISVRLAEIKGNLRGQFNGKEIILNSNLSPIQKKKTLIHEIQHYIQSVENFARGGNEKTGLYYAINDAYSEAIKQPEYKKLKTPDERIDFTFSLAEKRFNVKGIENVAFKAYRNLHGEVEARETSNLMNFNDEVLKYVEPNTSGKVVVNKNDELQKFVDNLQKMGYTEDEVKNLFGGVDNDESRGNETFGRRYEKSGYDRLHRFFSTFGLGTSRVEKTFKGTTGSDRRGISSSLQISNDEAGLNNNSAFSYGEENAKFSLDEIERKGNGYDGYSMSNNARYAYVNGEKPLSKWSKSVILNAIDNFASDNNLDINIDKLSKLTLSELRDNMLYKSSWHHTGKMYNQTNFYSINEDVVSELSNKTIDDIISNRKKAIDVVKADKSELIKTALKEYNKGGSIDESITSNDVKEYIDTLKENPKLKTYNADVTITEFEKRRPHKVEYNDVTVTEKGNWYYIKDQSREFKKKKDSSYVDVTPKYNRYQKGLLNRIEKLTNLKKEISNNEFLKQEREYSRRLYKDECVHSSNAEKFMESENYDFSVSYSGNIYAKGRKPDNADYEKGLENYFKKGEKRLTGANRILFLQEWDGNKWVTEKDSNVINEAKKHYNDLLDRGLEDSAEFFKNDLKSKVGIDVSDNSVKFSVDDDYIKAVENGDTKTAQEMVDEQAEKAGYTIKAYHGTPNGEFNTFKDWQYFTESKEYADVYQNQGASSNGYKQTANNPRTYEVYIKPEKVFDTRNATEKEIFDNEFYMQWGNGAPLSEKGLPDWTDGDDLIEFFDENGYDYDTILLDEGATGGYGDEVKDRGISIVVKKSNQIKSADAITYDDDGNVIPLSKRFDENDNDIRFSLSDEDTDYMSAVENGDTDKAQAMVEQSAMKWGAYSKDGKTPLELYHGTKSFGFTEFDLNRMDDKRSIFLTSSKEIASTYSGTETKNHITDGKTDNVDIKKLSRKELANYLNQNKIFLDKSWQSSEFRFFGTDEYQEIKTKTEKNKKAILEKLESVNVSENTNDGSGYNRVFGYTEEFKKQLKNSNAQLSNFLFDKIIDTEISDYYEKNNIISEKELIEFATDTMITDYLAENERGLKTGKILAVEPHVGITLTAGVDNISRKKAETLVSRLIKKGNYSLYAKLENPLIIDCNGRNWNNIRYEVADSKYEVRQDRYNKNKFVVYDKSFRNVAWVNGKNSFDTQAEAQKAIDSLTDKDNWKKYLNKTRDISKYAQEQKYDSVIFKDLTDNGGQNSNIRRDAQADIYIVFDPNAVKSADAITYDDDGNVIPLSKRFDESDNDIRFSVDDEVVDRYTKKQYNNFGWIVANEVLTEKEWSQYSNKLNETLTGKEPKNIKGERVITVGESSSDITALVYVKGTISNPIVTKVVRINSSIKEKYNINTILEELEECERQGYRNPYEFVEAYAGEKIFSKYERQDYDSLQEFKQRRKGKIGAEINSDSGKINNGTESVETNRTDSKAGLNNNSAFSNGKFSVDDESIGPKGDYLGFDEDGEVSWLSAEDYQKELRKNPRMAVLDKQQIELRAKSLLKDFQSKADSTEVATELSKIFTKLKNNPNGWEEIYPQVQDLAKNIYDNIAEQVSTGEVYEQIKDNLQGSPMVYDDDLKSEFSSDWNNFIRSNRAKLNLVKKSSGKGGIGIDVQYENLARELPGYFSGEAIGPKAQLEEILNVYNAQRYVYDTLNSDNESEIINEISSEIMSAYAQIDKIDRKSEKGKAQNEYRFGKDTYFDEDGNGIDPTRYKQDMRTAEQDYIPTRLFLLINSFQFFNN